MMARLAAALLIMSFVFLLSSSKHLIESVTVKHRLSSISPVNQSANEGSQLTEQSAKQLEVKHEPKLLTEPNGERRKKRSYSHERYIELLIVADNRMSQYHKENLETYILTLMNSVSSLTCSHYVVFSFCAKVYKKYKLS